MTPEEAAHHAWLDEIEHRHPQIVDRSETSPAKLKSATDEANDNNCGKAHDGSLLQTDVATVRFIVN